jgi:hypothetical protein
MRQAQDDSHGDRLVRRFDDAEADTGLRPATARFRPDGFFGLSGGDLAEKRHACRNRYPYDFISISESR